MSEIRSGWVCPRCSIVNGPHVNSCSCVPASTFKLVPNIPQNINILPEFNDWHRYDDSQWWGTCEIKIT